MNQTTNNLRIEKRQTSISLVRGIGGSILGFVFFPLGFLGGVIFRIINPSGWTIDMIDTEFENVWIGTCLFCVLITGITGSLSKKGLGLGIILSGLIGWLIGYFMLPHVLM